MKKTRKVYLVISFTIIIIVAVFIFISLIRQHAVDYCVQNGSSMTPTIKSGEKFLLNKTAYETSKPKRWDIIAFNSPKKNKKIYIMRIIGLPGEKLESKNNSLFINGKKLNYPDNLKYLHYTPKFVVPKDVVFDLPQIKYPYIIPADSYYVRGDNNASAYDSRGWGAISIKNIIGKIIQK